MTEAGCLFDSSWIPTGYFTLLILLCPFFFYLFLLGCLILHLIASRCFWIYLFTSSGLLVMIQFGCLFHSSSQLHQGAFMKFVDTYIHGQ